MPGTLQRLFSSALLFVICIPNSYALTFKSDGSVVQKSGVVVTKGFADRFLSEIRSPTPNWAKSTGRKKQVTGYFGDDILLPGAPLLRIQGIKQGEDYLEAVFRLNGFSDKQSLYRYIVANATPTFVTSMELTETEVQAYLDASLEDFVNEAGLSNTELGQQIVASQLSASLSASAISKSIEDSVSSTIEVQLEESVSEAVEEAVEEAVDNWLDDLIAKYNINPEAITEIGDGWVTIDCNIDEC